jgi:hypothetical protein
MTLKVTFGAHLTFVLVVFEKAQEKARSVLRRKKRKKVEVFILFLISDYYLMCLASTYFLVTRFEKCIHSPGSILFHLLSQHSALDEICLL